MEKIRYDFTHENSVCQVILNDGKGNVLDSIMMNDLHKLFAELKDNQDIKLITFEGARNNFSFGASVQEHTKENCGEMLKSFHQLFYEIADLSIPMAAKISGQCLGGGMELALACNFLYADKTAKLGQPEIMLGVYAPPASILLPLKIGNAKAEEILLTGKTVDADRARQCGLINKVYDDKKAMDGGVDEWIDNTFANKSASSLRFATRVARKHFNEVLLKELPEIEKIYVNELMETKDANEGINSFLEKRKPIWRNR